jgi:hypothetical protein
VLEREVRSARFLDSLHDLPAVQPTVLPEQIV